MDILGAGTGARDPQLRMVDSISHFFCDGQPVGDEAASVYRRMGQRIDPTWRTDEPITPRLFAWARLLQVHALLGMVMKDLKELGMTATLEDDCQRLGAHMQAFSGELTDLAAVANVEGLVVGGSRYLRVASQAINAMVGLVRQIPTPQRALSLHLLQEENTPRFGNPQSEADYWSDRLLQAFLGIQSLLEAE